MAERARYGQYNAPVDWDSVDRSIALQQQLRHQQAVEAERAQAAQAAMIEAQAKAEEDAIRFKGHQEYEQLIAGGATPEEALRRTAHDLYFKNPAGMGAALRATAPKPVTPTSVTAIPILGPNKEVLGYGRSGTQGEIIPLPRPPAERQLPKRITVDGQDFWEYGTGQPERIPDKKETVLPGLRMQFSDVIRDLNDKDTPPTERRGLLLKKKEIERLMREAGATLAEDPQMKEVVIPMLDDRVKPNPLGIPLGSWGKAPQPITNQVPFYPDLPRPSAPVDNRQFQFSKGQQARFKDKLFEWDGTKWVRKD